MAVRRKKAAKKKTKKVASKRKRVAKKAARPAARKAAPRKVAARKTKAGKQRNRANIAAMGREAEAALEEPEGAELAAAESEARAGGLG